MTLHTSLGDIKLELYCDRAPKSCENFLALAASNYYDNTVFHRNIKGAAPAALHVPARARRAMAGSSIARGRRSARRQPSRRGPASARANADTQPRVRACCLAGFMLQGGDPTGTGKGGDCPCTILRAASERNFALCERHACGDMQIAPALRMLRHRRVVQAQQQSPTPSLASPTNARTQARVSMGSTSRTK